MRLKAVRIQTEDHVEELRILRNITSYGFSNFNGYISYYDQLAWWNNNQSNIEGWLYEHIDESVYVGFGLVRREDDGKWWNSIGVHPNYQGLGYGKYITHDILNRHNGVVFATIRKDNPNAIKMHASSDWETIEGPNTKLIYLRSK
ncbi:MAG TPA: GNAT family N-acetyltransferase [Ktedonobacteraceae bacterium]|nr:GNAT family N-acetyltransferase [Ktedonobacteraceae bacterium]